MKCQKSLLSMFVLGLLLIAMTACSSGGTTAEKPTTPPEPAKQEAVSPTNDPGKIETTIVPDTMAAAEAPKETSKFPLPKNAKIISNTDAMVIASVNMKMDEVIEFYRADAKANGLTEYELLTTITDNVFSMAFRRPNEDMELVIQGTAMDADNLTLSVRYEETDVK